MAKAIPCKLVVITSNGHICHAIDCNSISEAVKAGKESWGFTYKVYDNSGSVANLLKQGFCQG